MGWNRRDDGCNDHPKIRALGNAETDLLWQKAGVGCSKSKTGGLIAPADLELYAFLAYARTPAKLRRATQKLVEVKLWHDATTVKDCSRCMAALADMDLDELPAGAFLIHDWQDCNPSKRAEDDDVTKFKQRRDRQLKDWTVRRAEVLARDGEWCRYCAVRTTSKKYDQKSALRRVIDHVDPMGSNALGNLATACNRCNGRKKDRLPDEAEMPLLAPPVDGRPPIPFPDGYKPIDACDEGPGAAGEPALTAAARSERIKPESGRIEPRIEPENQPDHDPPSCDVRGGPGRVGLDPGLDLGSVGSGRVGPGSAGPGLSGLGVVGAGRGLADLVRAGSGVGASPPTDVSAADAVAGAGEDPAADVTEESSRG